MKIRVFAYESADPDCPPGQRALARAQIPSGPKGALEWSGVFAYAATADEARAKIERYFSEVEAKAASTKPRGRPPKVVAAAPLDDDGEAI